MTRRRRLILLVGLAALLLAVTAYLGVLWVLPGTIVDSPNQGKTARELGDPDAHPRCAQFAA